MKRLVSAAPWLVLAVVLAAGGWYVSGLRGEIRRLKAENAPAAPKPAPAAEGAPAPDTAAQAADAGRWQLTDAERSAMLFHLGAEGTSVANPIWFVTDSRNPDAVAMQRSLRRVFEEAGWQVRGNAPVTFQLKPGIFFLMADEEAPEFVQTALGAFEAAGITVSAGSGYRAFYKEKKAADPKWQGFDMAADQPYVVVVGRRPPPAAPEPAAAPPVALPE